MMNKNLTAVRQVFLDMDGTIYHGSELFPTTIPFLNFLTERGIGYTFLSNNSSYGHEDYIARLGKFGIKTGPENFISPPIMPLITSVGTNRRSNGSIRWGCPA